ncbi:D-alanyl-D-alanine carboxypeptidase/D-alanyl-D-alanine-endopeptidase [Telluribacter sp. SYSU D00476]|uniref:D-alanyl-D-alanine carboxypeptidase/D-alanyl-D-alanine-endopeptidase n=1 Tax=Telluribacter sp. SYSU D00476 TaxID=2811430 RepID=UPI001FF13024|nr:D-alanyl-D-alanine carboxypeptidase [Telluribacter sp. SYSU D00476]
MRLLLFVLSILSLSSCSVSHYVKREVKKSPVLSGHHVGIAIYDPARQKTLAAHQADKYFTPASNTKLFSLYAGLSALGDSLPGLQYILRGDSLIFWGTGDPSLLHPDLTRSAVYSFLRGRPEQLYFSPTNFQDERFGPGWAWSDYNDYYQPERSPLPVYGNFARFVSDSARLLYVGPRYWADSLLTDPAVSGIRRDEDRNLFRHSLYALPAGLEQDVPVKMSHQVTADLLAHALNRPVGVIEEPLEEVRFSTVYSIPSDSLYARMMQVSDNMLAEQLMLLYATANGLPLNTEQAIEHVLEHHLADLPDRPVWRDGSGLSRYNLFTPRTQVKLLDKIYNKVPRERLFAILPQGGKTGTLRNMFKGSGEPYVFAKTGSLSNNYSLSGYLVTRKGRTLLFSFMNNNYTRPTSEIRKEVERVLTGLHRRY